MLVNNHSQSHLLSTSTTKYNHTLCNVAGEQIWVEMIFLKLTFDPIVCSSTATLLK